MAPLTIHLAPLGGSRHDIKQPQPWLLHRIALSVIFSNKFHKSFQGSFMSYQDQLHRICLPSLCTDIQPGAWAISSINKQNFKKPWALDDWSISHTTPCGMHSFPFAVWPFFFYHCGIYHGTVRKKTSLNKSKKI